MTIMKILNIIQPLIKAYRKIKELLLDFKSAFWRNTPWTEWYKTHPEEKYH